MIKNDILGVFIFKSMVENFKFFFKFFFLSQGFVDWGQLDYDQFID